jgi:hypothetical protein
MWFGRPYILCWSGNKLWELHVLSDELSLRNYLAGGKGTPKQREAREEHTGENRAARKRPQQRTAGTTSKEFTTESSKGTTSKKTPTTENSKGTTTRNSQQRTAGTTGKKTPTTENNRNNKQENAHNRETRSNESEAIGLRPRFI